MMTSADKVGGWVKKGQNHDDVILEHTCENTVRRKCEYGVFQITNAKNHTHISDLAVFTLLKATNMHKVRKKTREIAAVLSKTHVHTL
jgi:hypothetical protein